MDTATAMHACATRVVLLCVALMTGPGHAQDATPAVGGPPSALQAQFEARAALDRVLQATERGDVEFVRQQISPSLIGYQRLLDGLRRDAATQRFARIVLLGTQVTSSADLVMIQSAWEKRFFGIVDGQPSLQRGQATFLLKRSGDGWQLAAIGGDNPLASASGALAQLEARVLSVSCSAAPFQIQLNVSLSDADLAGLGQVSVEVSTSAGDREGLLLVSQGPGRFVSVAPIPCTNNPSGPFDGLLRVSGPTVLTVRYVDANPGGGRPSATLSRQMQLP
ncbi:nuclear transport factor 2 family protein [Azohydromonas sediminis]|uniref:nuclear transport factor 2 family protein n=1 Tax=Azohydromonas sediminis TaxID=2259674 RepID=UPI0013C3071D|nr:nuclear transport factor 2 family protein [Azohydromonas sediminis]